MEEGDNGDGEKPEPKSEVELLVNNIVWQNAQRICMGFISPSAKLEEGQIRIVNNWLSLTL